MQYISFYERFYELLIREPYIKNSISVALIWVVWDIIKNDGHDWTHFEIPIWHFIQVKWGCLSQSIQKSSNSFQCLQNWKEFDDFWMLWFMQTHFTGMKCQIGISKCVQSCPSFFIISPTTQISATAMQFLTQISH